MAFRVDSYASSAGNADVVQMFRGTGGGSDARFSLYLENFIGAAEYGTNAIGLVIPGTWYILAMTCAPNPSYVVTYYFGPIGGPLIQVPNAYTLQVGTNNIYFGFVPDVQYYGNISVCEARFWDGVALTAVQVQAESASATPVTAGVTHRWFNSGAANLTALLNDAVGSVNLTQTGGSAAMVSSGPNFASTTTMNSVRQTSTGNQLTQSTAIPSQGLTITGWFNFYETHTNPNTFISISNGTHTLEFTIGNLNDNYGLPELLLDNTTSSSDGGYVQEGEWYFGGLYVSAGGTGACFVGRPEANSGAGVVHSSDNNVPAFASSVGIAVPSFSGTLELLNSANGFWVNGSLRDVRIFNSALTNAQLVTEMMSSSPQAAGCRSWYKLTSPTDLTDHVGSYNLVAAGTVYSETVAPTLNAHGAASLSINTIGDSLTAGLNPDTAPTEYPYGPILEGLQPYNVMNSYGISGATTEDMETYFNTEAMTSWSRTLPNVILLLGGTNDLLQGVTPAQAFANITDLVHMAQSRGFWVLNATVIKSFPYDSYTEANRSTLNASILANTEAADGIVNLAVNAAYQDTTNTTYYASDQEHLTLSGYTVMANVWATGVSTLQSSGVTYGAGPTDTLFFGLV
jgi:lysophospholipase L1-like esterase